MALTKKASIEDLAVALIRARRAKIEARAARNRILREGCKECGEAKQPDNDCPKCNRYPTEPCPYYDEAQPHHIEYRKQGRRAASLLCCLDRAVTKRDKDGAH